MAKVQHRKVSLTRLNLFCHYTHGVADTSLVSLDARLENFYPARPDAEKVPLTRKNYVDGTLRNRLGLPQPANRFASKQLCQNSQKSTRYRVEKTQHRPFRDHPRKRVPSCRRAIPAVAHGDAMTAG